MRSKKSKRRGSGSSSRPPSKSPSLTPNKTAGRRGRPPSKSPSTVLPPQDSSSHVSQENHNHSVSPDHSRTSSSDQDGFQAHPTRSAFNSKPPQPLDIGMANSLAFLSFSIYWLDLSRNFFQILAENPVPSCAQFPYISPNEAIERPRKLAKRERKALIKSSRRTRAAVDESFLASLDKLSDIFKSHCEVGVYEPHPVPMAADPSKLSTLQLTVPSPRSGKNRRGKPLSNSPSSPGSNSKPVFASFTPLCLPYGGISDRLKSPGTQLKELTPRCVRRFLVGPRFFLFHQNGGVNAGFFVRF